MPTRILLAEDHVCHFQNYLSQFSIICRATMIRSHQLDCSRSLFQHRDECGFNGLQACDDRLWIIEIALFG
jgi:hypothetical protein